MKPTVTIIDYGMSNLLSITRAFEHIGADVVVTEKSADINAASYLVLPGVGAFPKGMKALHEQGLTDAIREHASSGKPLFGVCLGMQMLFDRSFERGETEGLSLIPGEVLPLPTDVPGWKVPNINWHTVKEPTPGKWKGTPLEGAGETPHFYFVHSFYVQAANDDNCLGTTSFANLQFTSAAIDGNVIGTQFHPEKSGELGLKLLKKFIAI